MQTYTNTTGVSLPLAVWLATDHYDYDAGTISATGIMKPLRQRVLAARVPKDLVSVDVIQMVKSRLGTALHDSMEKAWQNPVTRKFAIASLGYPASVADRIVMNPRKWLHDHGYSERSLAGLYMEEDVPNMIPVFMEIRGYRDIGGYTVSGKFDFAAEGRVRDLKSTGTFTYTNNTKADDYKTQGSIYRWLHPHIVNDDVMAVEFLFTDWAAFNLKSQKNYPPAPVMHQHIPLMDVTETEQFITAKLAQFDHYKKAHESDLPECTDVELWRKENVYKYYSGGQVVARSTKNFETAREAHTFMSEKGGKGIVVEVKGEVVACRFCPAFPVCTQKDRLIADGSLIV